MIAYAAVAPPAPSGDPQTAADRLRRRISEWLSASGTLAQLAERLEMSSGSLHERLYGRKKGKHRKIPPFPVEDLEKVAEFFDVSLLELLADENDALWSLREDECRVVTHYRNLPREHRERIIGLLDFLVPVGHRENELRELAVKLRRLTPAGRAAVLGALETMIARQPQTRVPMPEAPPAETPMRSGIAAPAQTPGKPRRRAG